MPRRPNPKPVNAGYRDKAPSEVHVAFAEYITTTVGIDGGVSPEVVALVQRLYPLYLKSDEVVKAREAEQATRAAEQARKDAEKAARLKIRLDRINEQRDKILAELGIEEKDNVLDAAARFTDDSGIVVVEAEDVFVAEADDDEPQAAEVTVADDDDDDDDWDDDTEGDDDDEF